MKVIHKTWDIEAAVRREGNINPSPQFQRTPVWSEKKNKLLLDSILRCYDIPKIYLRKVEEGEYEYEVVDGQQRLRAIWNFFKDKYELGEESADLFEGSIAGKKYSELSIEVKEKLALYELSFTIVEGASEVEIKDLFMRMQEGVPLNPAEKRNAMLGEMRNFIADLTSHEVFTIIPLADKRYSYADWIAHVVCLELAKGPTDVKAPDLKKMYEDEKRFKNDSGKAKKVKKVLGYMKRCFDEQVPELNIKWGFVDLYLLISILMEGYVMQDKNSAFGDFYTGFEQGRREVEDEADLLNGNYWEKDLYNYIQAFKISGGIRKNIETRNKVYTNKFFKDNEELVAKDNKRSFDENQKTVIWRRDGGKCKQCGKSVEYEDMHADHIKRHADGGSTTIKNGQTLCARCNQRKG